MNSLARQIKERLTAREVVEFYGFHPDRAGYIQCPFHAEKTASLKVYGGDKGWYCFGCGAGRDVIDFTMRLFEIDFHQACLRLNVDFNLGLSGERPSRAERFALLEARHREAEQKAAMDREYRRMAAEYRYWWDVMKYFAPAAGDTVLHPLYGEALRRLPVLGNWLDENMGR